MRDATLVINPWSLVNMIWATGVSFQLSSPTLRDKRSYSLVIGTASLGISPLLRDENRLRANLILLSMSGILEACVNRCSNSACAHSQADGTRLRGTGTKRRNVLPGSSF